MSLKRINSLHLILPRALFLRPRSSFLRKQESSEQAFLIKSLVAYWIPACAGMTNRSDVRSVVSVSSVANF